MYLAVGYRLFTETYVIKTEIAALYSLIFYLTTSTIRCKNRRTTDVNNRYFDVLLTVYLSIILVINQLNTKILAL